MVFTSGAAICLLSSSKRPAAEVAPAAKLYGALTGIISASPNLSGGDGPTICLTREGDLWHYVFDQASGDCLAGCSDHSYRHFSTDGEGGVSAQGALTSASKIALYASQEACH